MNRLRRLCVFLLVLSPAVLLCQTSVSTESGKFRLHKFEQPIGEETYTITSEGNTLSLKSDFKFTDRGTPVPLTATLRTSDSYVPQSFVIKGQTSRSSTIDTDVTISNGNATIRQGKDTRTAPVPQTFFTISGYAPVAVQMEMMRYWRTHGQPAQMTTLPIGAVRIQDRGSQTMEIRGRDVQVERYTVQGLIWGMETLWMDSNNNLAALVSTDAEFDHFEA
ncbi:MAG: amidohydrolase, partial [Candidatus Korobacteraceae bacterium]